MDIRIGNYRIKSDSYCVAVMKEIITQSKGRSPGGKKREVLVGYYPRLGMALEGLLERQIKDSEAETVGQLLAEIRAAKEVIREVTQGVTVDVR